MTEYLEISSDPAARKIVDGFRLDSITLRNAASGEKAWTSAGWTTDVFTAVKEAHLPAKMLTFPSVGRETVFSTAEVIRDFRIEQKVMVHGSFVEQWNYDFGFVIPGSTNSWETIVEAAGEGKMMPAEVLSGNMFILTSFYAGKLFLARNVIKVFYE
jgi:retinal rod rhodopsin-sensitive cGMP 3',5'-cyclic phosphodiesterase subunit delta